VPEAINNFLIYSSQVFFIFYPPYQVFYSVGGYSPSLYDILPDPYNLKVTLWRFYLA